MAFTAKNRYGKRVTFDVSEVYFEDENGEKVQFSIGGTSEDVRYVTFMNHDGTVEYGKKAVAIGDDCADPIARGIFGTPTRESDVQNDYSFANGWATEPNGAAVSSWNKAITEDKVVYAVFISTLRKYTITYLDNDGTTVLNTENLDYGAIPSYVPAKSGLDFSGWVPEVEAVTGDVSYTATWSEKVEFATASWPRIAEIARNGQAKDYFKVGDTKTISCGGETLTVAIAGFDVDDIWDGSGKAPITIICQHVSNYTSVFADSTSKYFNESKVKSTLTSIYQALPSDLKEAIKSVKKLYDKSVDGGTTTTGTQNGPVWAPALSEMGLVPSNVYPALGDRYPLYPEVNNVGDLPKIARPDGTYVSYWYPRNIRHIGVMNAACWKESTRSVDNVQSSNLTSKSFNILFGFCIA